MSVKRSTRHHLPSKVNRQQSIIDHYNLPNDQSNQPRRALGPPDTQKNNTTKASALDHGLLPLLRIASLHHAQLDTDKVDPAGTVSGRLTHYGTMYRGTAEAILGESAGKAGGSLSTVQD